MIENLRRCCRPPHGIQQVELEKTMGKDYDKCSKGDKRYIIFKYINAHTYTCRCMHLSKNAYKYNYTLHNYLITLHYLEELLSFSLHSNSNLFKSIHLF